MKVLVTGGAGFLGQRICYALVQFGIDAISFDLAPCPSHGTRSIIGSILDLPNLRQAVTGCDAIVHAAAVLGVQNTDSQPRYTMDVIAGGTRNIVDVSDAVNVRRLIYLSSSEVYGGGGQAVQPGGASVPLSVAGSQCAVVDADLFESLSKFCWHAVKGKNSTKPYVARSFKGPAGEQCSSYLHHQVWELSGRERESGLQIDHRNGDSFDNRISNLRQCTREQNQQNRKPNERGACPYKGVRVEWRRSPRPFRAVITVSKQRRSLGYFDNPIQAALAYDQAARADFGEFARPNFPPPFAETDRIYPQSVYAVAKLAGEEYVKAASVPWLILRPFSVYGPGQRSDFVVSRFIGQAQRGEDLTVYWDGQQVRCFCFVDDLALAVLKAVTVEQGLRTIYNIGNDQEPVTIRQLAEAIIEAVHRGRVRTNAAPDRSADREIQFRVPNLTRIRNALGWEAKVTLTSGIRRTANELCTQLEDEK